MRTRERNIAEHFGILERLEDFEKALLKIDGITTDSIEDGIGFDLSPWQSEIRYVIIVPRYDIAVERPDYCEARYHVIQEILDTAGKFGLNITEDSIEDFGAHWYFVFRCNSTWPSAQNFTI